MCWNSQVNDYPRRRHHLGISWDVVKEIQKKYLHKKFSKPKLNNLRQLAIDEISIAKGTSM